MKSRWRTVAVFAVGVLIGSLLAIGTSRSVVFAQARATGADELAVLRYFRIKKGAFNEFYQASVDRVWPSYEKAGARIIGMWQVSYPAVPGQARTESPDYDEVYLLTRYTSIEHWQATRDEEIEKIVGDTPDLVNLREGFRIRRNLTIPQGPAGQITVLRGRPAFNGPYFPKPLAQRK